MEGRESRRRHTRYIGDWSSDVCSSDLKNNVDSEVMSAELDHPRRGRRRLTKNCDVELAASKKRSRRLPCTQSSRHLFVENFVAVHDVDEIGRASCREGVNRWRAAKAEDGIRDTSVTGVQTCALPISRIMLIPR